MLTIKHVEKSGHQSIVTAGSVCFDPAVGENNEFPKGQLLALDCPDGMGMDFTRYASGTAFVMNERGSTVARYDLE